MEELVGQTEILLTESSEMVIGCDDPEDKVYNRGKLSRQKNKYYKYTHECNYFNLSTFPN